MNLPLNGPPGAFYCFWKSLMKSSSLFWSTPTNIASFIMLYLFFVAIMSKASSSWISFSWREGRAGLLPVFCVVWIHGFSNGYLALVVQDRKKTFWQVPVPLSQSSAGTKRVFSCSKDLCLFPKCFSFNVRCPIAISGAYNLYEFSTSWKPNKGTFMVFDVSGSVTCCFSCFPPCHPGGNKRSQPL